MKALRTLAPLFWKYKGRMIAGVIFILLTNIFAVFAPALIGEGVNTLRDAYTTYLSPESTNAFAQPSTLELPQILSEVARFTGLSSEWDGNVESAEDVYRLVALIAIFQALLYMIVYFIKGIFLFLTRQTIIINSRLMEFDLKERIYGHYQKLDAQFYKKNDTGDLMNRISEDVSKVRMFLGPAVMYSINLFVLIIIVVSVMVSIDLKLTLFALLPLPLMSIGIYFISSKINRLSDAVASQQSDLSSFVQQHISGIRVLQSYHREFKAATRFEKESDKYKEKALNLVKVESMFIPLVILLVGLSTVLTVYVGGMQVIKGKLELGHIFQFIFYVNILTWPFASVGWVTSLVQKAEASMARILNFLDSKPSISDSSEDFTDPTKNSGLTFNNVSYTYPDTGIEALKNISFDLKPGQTIAITGKTGSGKSTVAMLSMRLMDPNTGDITLDGIELPRWPLQKLRSKTGYVPQDVFLFSDTIENNISFGKSSSDSNIDEEIVESAQLAAVHNDIINLENGYKTILGERGVNLSGGQKQRISIARAVIRKPRLLILDDCLSAVDTNTEAHILGSLAKLNEKNPDLSTLMVSHRISTIKHADQILVIDNGELIESGTHQELLALGGLYSQMNTRQQTKDETI